MLKVTVLGCGPSLGVPVIGCKCLVCTSDSIYNKRSRSAIYIQANKSKILVDFGCDIRNQLINSSITQIDGVIATHSHADHVNGIDDLRVFAKLQNKALDIHTNIDTSNFLLKHYAYLFDQKILKLEVVNFNEEISIKDQKVQIFRQDHGRIDSLGIRVNGFVYSNDLADFPVESVKYLQNIDVWILDCIDYKSNDRHSGLDKILFWNNQFRPNKIFLTNMHHNIDYYEIKNKLPNNIFPLYDRYEILI